MPDLTSRIRLDITDLETNATKADARFDAVGTSAQKAGEKVAAGMKTGEDAAARYFRQLAESEKAEERQANAVEILGAALDEARLKSDRLTATTNEERVAIDLLATTYDQLTAAEKAMVAEVAEQIALNEELIASQKAAAAAVKEAAAADERAMNMAAKAAAAARAEVAAMEAAALKALEEDAAARVKAAAAEQAANDQWMGKLATGLGELVSPANIAAIAVAGLTAVLADAVKEGADFDQLMQHLQANTGVSDAVSGQMRSHILGLSAQTGVDPEQLAAGYQAAFKSTQDEASALQILNLATQANVGSGADLAKTAETLGTIFHETGMQISGAAPLLNMLMGATQKSKLEMGDFGDQFTKLAAYANSVHVPLSDVTAAVETLRDHGLSTSQAMMTVGQILHGIVQPSKEQSEAIAFLSEKHAALKDVVSASGLAHHGLIGFIDGVSSATGHDIEAQDLLMKSFKAQQGGLILLNQGHQEYHDQIKNNTDFLTGKATPEQDNYNKAIHNLNNEWAAFRRDIANEGIEIGHELAEPLAEALHYARALFDTLKGEHPYVKVDGMDSLKADLAVVEKYRQWSLDNSKQGLNADESKRLTDISMRFHEASSEDVNAWANDLEKKLNVAMAKMPAVSAKPKASATSTDTNDPFTNYLQGNVLGFGDGTIGTTGTEAAFEAWKQRGKESAKEANQHAAEVKAAAKRAREEITRFHDLTLKQFSGTDFAAQSRAATELANKTLADIAVGNLRDAKEREAEVIAWRDTYLKKLHDQSLLHYENERAHAAKVATEASQKAWTRDAIGMAAQTIEDDKQNVSEGIMSRKDMIADLRTLLPLVAGVTAAENKLTLEIDRQNVAIKKDIGAEAEKTLQLIEDSRKAKEVSLETEQDELTNLLATLTPDTKEYEKVLAALNKVNDEIREAQAAETTVDLTKYDTHRDKYDREGWKTTVDRDGMELSQSIEAQIAQMEQDPFHFIAESMAHNIDLANREWRSFGEAERDVMSQVKSTFIHAVEEMIAEWAAFQIGGALGAFGGPVGSLIGSIGGSILGSIFGGGGHHGRGEDVAATRATELASGYGVSSDSTTGVSSRAYSAQGDGSEGDNIVVHVTTGDINNLGGLETLKSHISRAVQVGRRTPAAAAVANGW